jgi:hypothetical protein
MSKMLAQAHVLNWFANRALPSKERDENSDHFHFSQCRHSVPLIINWLCYSRDDSAIIHDFTRRLRIVLLLVYSSFQFTAPGCPLLCTGIILSSIPSSSRWIHSTATCKRFKNSRSLAGFSLLSCHVYAKGTCSSQFLCLVYYADLVLL